MTGAATRWSARGPLGWGLLTLALLIGGLGAWSVLTSLAGAIIAPGQIEVSQNRQVVQHLDGGIVADVLVKEGDAVLQGQVLLRLDGSAIVSDLAIVENQLYELEARQARLEAQSGNSGTLVFSEDLKTVAQTHPDVAEIMTGQATLFAKQAETLTQITEQLRTRAQQIESQMTGFRAQQDAIDVQIVILEKELAAQEALLAKGLTQAPRVSELELQLAQLMGRFGELTSSLAEAAGRVTEIDIQITSQGADLREKAEAELRDVTARLLELRERKEALKERISRLEVRAPASGLVLDLKVTTPGSVIRPADPLMFIVPQDRALIVTAHVPVTHVDEVEPGQDVRLVFSALPSRVTPDLYGKVTIVSADAFSDERTGAVYFRVEIAINPESLGLLGDEKILPGMPVEAFIVTTSRTPLSYLLKPFTDYFDTAFRET